jgi:hypothetical protein
MCNHADAQDDTTDEDQDARSLILDKLQGRSRCRKMPVCQSCNGSEWVVRALYDSQTCTYRVSEMYDSHTWKALSTDDLHAARTIKKIQFLHGWWAARKWVARVTYSIRTAHVQTSQKHYFLYGMATVNKFAGPVRAKTRMAECKTSLNMDTYDSVFVFFILHNSSAILCMAIIPNIALYPMMNRLGFLFT